MGVSDFKYGLINYLNAESIPRGASSSEINFLSLGSRQELRKGYMLLGNTRQSGSGKITGLITAHKWDGTEIVFRARGQKIEYLDISLTPADWVEVGTNLLGSAADGEDISFGEYFSPAGAQLWISSPNSDLIKIMTANPGDYASQYLSGTNFKGDFQITTNRMFLWNYLRAGAITNALGGKTSRNTLQVSYIDAQNYTTVTAENTASGDGTTKTFTHTLAFKAGGSRRTCFGVSVTDGTETFTDDYMGNLTGSLGGTGTVNYMTGAISVTFNTAPSSGTNNITSTYQWEDSASNGIADFTRAGTRLAGTGASFLQNEGGDLLNVFDYNNVKYCVHERVVYQVTIGSDDTTATNLIYRDRMGMPAWHAGVPTSDGIYYVDTTDSSRQFFAVITINQVNQQVLPKDLSSERLDLSGYSFDQSYAFEWDQYIIWAARTTDSTTNNVMFLYNKIFGCFDVVDFYANSISIYGGVLIGGDSATNNVFYLFSGFDDDGNVPNSYWIGNIDNYSVDSLKKVKQLWVEGYIQSDQVFDVYASVDHGAFALIGTISGNGAYVDKNTSVSIGTNGIGTQVIGGGNTGTVTANHYITNLKLALGTFRAIQIKIQSRGIGYLSFIFLNHFDIRIKQDKLPQQYRS